MIEEFETMYEYKKDLNLLLFRAPSKIVDETSYVDFVSFAITKIEIIKPQNILVDTRRMKFHYNSSMLNWIKNNLLPLIYNYSNKLGFLINSEIKPNIELLDSKGLQIIVSDDEIYLLNWLSK
jgi:hypothetical protein